MAVNYPTKKKKYFLVSHGYKTKGEKDNYIISKKQPQQSKSGAYPSKLYIRNFLVN